MPSFKASPHAVIGNICEVVASDFRGNVVEAYNVTGFGIGSARMTPKDLRDRSRSLLRDEAGNGLYVVKPEGEKPRRFEIDYKSGVVDFDDGSQIDIELFMHQGLRTDADGKILCALSEPLVTQFESLKEAGSKAALHLHDLAALAAIRREETLSTEIGMYDIAASGLEDEVDIMTSFENRSRAETAYQVAPTLFDAMAENGLPPQAWIECHAHPHFGMEQVRSLFRQLLGPFTQDFPVERVMMVAAPSAEMIIDILDASADLIETHEPFTAPNIMPGYATSEVRRYRRDGAEVVVFSDIGGAYAYAWPIQPEPAPRPGF